ncbi:MAG: threonine dehydratase [Rhizobiaceae bacterium]
MLFSLNELMNSSKIVYDNLDPTPQIQWPVLNTRAGADVWVKHENHTPIGAFKVRGGCVYLNHFKKQNPDALGLITATRGNHGQSIARAATKAGIPVTILVPEGNSVEKNRAMEAFGAELIISGKDFDEACSVAVELSKSRNLSMIPSFHKSLTLGVGTYALELFNHVENLDTVYVPIGLGSGVCSMITVRDLLGLKTKIVGVVSKNADAYAQSFENNRIVTTKTANTFADGMACKVPQKDAMEIIWKGCERIVRVSEQEIRDAIIALYQDTHNVAEGAGAASFAALMQERQKMAGKRVGIILSGGNIDIELFQKVLSNSL